MNKTEKTTITDFYKQAMYSFKISLIQEITRGEHLTEITSNYKNVKELTKLCRKLNIDTTEYRKINKAELITFLNATVKNKKMNYYFSVNDLLKGDYTQLIKDAERLEATDELLYMLDTAMYFNFITENLYQLIREELEKVL